MLRYSLAKLVDRPKGTVVELPPVDVRLSAEKQQYAALRSMLNGIATEAREYIIPLYQQEQDMKRAARAFTGDADRAWFASLQALANQLQRIASDTVSRILDLEAQRHTDTFMATAKRALGINLSSVVRDEDLAEYLQAAVARNTSLIQSLSDDIVKRIEQTVYTNSIAGNSVTTLRKELQTQFGITDRRARLIARDQTAKFNSDLNKIRQQQAGVTSYVWMTAHDERVRPLHKKLDGNTYKWGEATGAEQGLPPGQPINCRCVARGIVEF
ncbi:minor capsid protein [Rhizobium sp. YAF28]|uniref:phage head morphogenesis protein n=1 Tax=Rhizobium sp. YAF28 TaxID=3233081 RepID=UPI003F984739